MPIVESIMYISINNKEKNKLSQIEKGLEFKTESTLNYFGGFLKIVPKIWI